MSPEPAEIKVFHRALRQWYRREGRHHLPWRQTNDPYPIWLSEVMLQQTQVQTVLERYYFPFLERFPTIEALARADLQEVLKCWEGLGYYTRARNLHRAAQMAVGGLPNTAEALLALPGIGRNTAHAIAAFAYRQPVPILEANVKRIVARICALKTPSDKELWAAATQLLDTRHPFDYNQAMMDLGAMLCTPKNPQCYACPANIICRGQNNPTAYPQKKLKNALPIRETQIVLFTLPTRQFYISPRKDNFLHGLWQFPEVCNNKFEIKLLGKNYKIASMQTIGQISHAYSHFVIKSNIYKSELNLNINDFTFWKTAEEITHLPLSRTEKKILKLI